MEKEWTDGERWLLQALIVETLTSGRAEVSEELLQNAPQQFTKLEIIHVVDAIRAIFIAHGLDESADEIADEVNRTFGGLKRRK